MKLEDIREKIDEIDLQIKELIMQRLDCSHEVVLSKITDKNFNIYRADREADMLKKLGGDVPADRRDGYLAVVRKVTETSRMYQYGVLFDSVPALRQQLFQNLLIPKKASTVKIRLSRPDQPNAMSAILSMIGDYGYNMKQLILLGYSHENGYADFELTLLGDLNEENMQKLMFQLSKESRDFNIIEVI